MSIRTRVQRRLLALAGLLGAVALPAAAPTVVADAPPPPPPAPSAAITASGARSATSRAGLEAVRPGAPDPDGPAVEVRADTRRLRPELGGTVSVSFYVRGDAPADVTVDVVAAGRRAPLAKTLFPAVAPGTVASIEWDGTAAGAPLPEGRYVFRVTRGAVATTGAARAATSAREATGRSAVWVVRSRFPIVGPHTYGEGFGAARGGHRHQGQDVFAACGTPLVAAHAGTVRYAGFQGAAGNYLVIAPAEHGPDIVYMHLGDRPLVGDGDRVERGQRVGFVGRSGDAVGCHLHFELWTAPGWYRGGRAVDPLATLRSWDG